MRAALVDRSGRIITKHKVPSPRLDGLAGVDRIVKFIGEFAASAGVTLPELDGVGIGIPGWVDRMTGQIRFAPKLVHWEGVPILARLNEGLPCPLYLDVDPHVATLGEQWLGAGRGKRNFVLLTLGTGIGCGIVINGQLYAGHRGYSSEFGHSVVAFGNPEASKARCACGTPGCLESLTAGPAIGRAGQEAARAGRAPLLLALAGGGPESITAETVVAAAQQGDGVALEILGQAGRFLGIGCANLASILEPERIVVGGGLAEVGELLLAPIREAMEKWCYLIAQGYIHVELVPAELGDDAGIVGAAKMVFDRAD
jgi:glucokinase